MCCVVLFCIVPPVKAEPQIIYFFFADKFDNKQTQEYYEIKSDYNIHMNKLKPWFKEQGITYIFKSRPGFEIKNKSKQVIVFSGELLGSNSGYVIVRDSGEYKISRSFGTGFDMSQDIAEFLDIKL